MNSIEITSIGILIPFLGTTLGSAFVFLLKDKMTIFVKKILLGFSAGVMIAASIWSLLIPAINMAQEQGKVEAWVPASLGFSLGIISLMYLDKKVGNIEEARNKKKNQTIKDKVKSTSMLVLAVTLHNIPEGMAVGVAFAGLIIGNAGITIAGALALAIGIAIQNIPEGAIISMPLKSDGMPKGKAFLRGMLSGIVEPIGAIITVLLTEIVVPVLPYLLSYAAGAMMYVVTSELVPEMREGPKANIGTVGLTLGFIIMMILDVALG